MYAVIKIGGKQFRVSEGDTIEVQKLDSKDGRVELNEALLLVTDKDVKVGKPTLKTKVVGRVLKNFKGEKIRVAKFKAKSRYRRTAGFRPLLSLLKIEKIEA